MRDARAGAAALAGAGGDQEDEIDGIEGGVFGKGDGEKENTELSMAAAPLWV